MKKFLKVDTGASGATGEGGLFAVDKIEKIALDTTNNAIDINGLGGAKSIDLSLSVVAGKEAKVADKLIETIAEGKSPVLDVLNFDEDVRGPEITAAYTEGDVATGAAITYTVAAAIEGTTFEATITDSAGVSLTDSGTFTDATTPGLSFDDSGATLTAGASTVVVNIFYPNSTNVAKTYSIAVTTA